MTAKITAVKISRTYGYNLDPLKVMRITEKETLQVAKKFLGITTACQGKKDFKNQNNGVVWDYVHCSVLLTYCYMCHHICSYIQSHYQYIF